MPAPLAMAPMPSEPSTPIGASPLTTLCTSVGGCRLRTSALMPYLANRPCWTASHVGAKAAAGCEKGISIAPLATGLAAADPPAAGFAEAKPLAAGLAAVEAFVEAAEAGLAAAAEVVAAPVEGCALGAAACPPQALRITRQLRVERMRRIERNLPASGV